MLDITAKVKFPFEMTFLDYPDNYSWAILIYMVGCDHNCLNCHNKQLQDLKHDNNMIYEVDITSILIELNRYSDKYMTNRVVLSGGDPLSKYNINLTRQILDYGRLNYDICVYTGYDIEYVKNNRIEGFKFIKTGKYIQHLAQHQFKNDDFMQLASKNQSIYNEKFELITNNGLLNFKNMENDDHGYYAGKCEYNIKNDLSYKANT